MKKLRTILKKKEVYFSTKLPSHNQILKVLNSQRKTKKLNRTIIAQPTTNITPFVICDRKLQHYSEIKSWLRHYPVYFVSAGEKLKNLDVFPTHINNILKRTNNKKISVFISLGGGSVGDFTGFVASVYKRRTPLIHIPSTWLSAMDSTHGGKTALNTKEIKNMIGSYCFPKAVFIVKQLLSSLPKKEQESTKGELVKIALIEGGVFYKEVLKQYKTRETLSHSDLWHFLPQAVFSKLKIVEKDPYEKKGIRRLLNFGHTLGHALESYFSIPHGKAVLYGITFAVQWSHNRFTLSPAFLKEISLLAGKQKKLTSYLREIPKHKLSQLLLQDKKRASTDRINFIFLKGPGRVFAEEISVKKIIKEVKNQSLFQ